MAAPKPGGFKLSFANAKNKDALKPKQSTPLAKRPRLALDDDEPDDTNKSQAISGWDTATGGAIDLGGKKKEEKALLVIPSLPNRNWRTESSRKQPPNQQEAKAEEEEKPEIKYGLTTFKKKDEDGSEGQTLPDAPAPPQPIDDGLTEEERLDKAAREALQNGKTEEHTVIPHITEEEAFQNDVKDAPEAPSLAAYEATPIDGFGAALLRGMGWKDGEEIGRNKGTTFKPKEIKRRPALLGIGAKDEAAVGIELGAWGNEKKGKGGKGGMRKVDQTFNPVVLRNKHTGEVVTEEELKRQLEAQQLVDEEEVKGGGKKSSRREGSRDGRDRREKEKRSKYDDYSEDDRRRERRYKERSDDKDDRKRDRRRDDYDDRKRDKRRDDYSEDDRRREKRRERDYSDDERRREKRRERRDRSRSRSPGRDSERERKRRRDYDYEDDRDERKRRHRYDDERRSRK